MQQNIKKALISVSNKQGVVKFAKDLQYCGIEIISSGGSAEYLRANGVKTTEISNITGFPEIMGGRVKTLHPKIHGGILARGEQDAAIMQQQNIENIDLVVVNLYPFEQTIAKDNCDLAEAVENIDIGGPTLIRGAAKNFKYKTVVVDPNDYNNIATMLALTNNISITTRFKLAVKAFAYTANYEDKIAEFFGKIEYPDIKKDSFPITLNQQYNKLQDLRYGENPHQKASFYIDKKNPIAIGAATQLQGKQLSFNNLVDADAAWECIQEFNHPACVIVKHANPCGVAVDSNITAAYNKAFAADPVSAFGGIIAINEKLDINLATTIINNQFAEVIIAPKIDQDAQSVLQQKQNIRVLIIQKSTTRNTKYNLKSISGGLLVQQQDTKCLAQTDVQIVTYKLPSEEEFSDLLFAWKVAKFVKSNAIVYAKNSQTIGIGAGQMSRVYSAKIASLKAIEHGYQLTNSVMASDAFFPFRDGIDIARDAGITSIIQPGGSIKDKEVIAAADEAGISMVFTGIRHFRH